MSWPLSHHYFQKDFRVQELPLARIKKIMKLDEDVKVQRWLTLHFSFLNVLQLRCYLLLLPVTHQAVNWCQLQINYLFFFSQRAAYQNIYSVCAGIIKHYWVKL